MSCGQCYKRSTIIIYDSIDFMTRNLPYGSTVVNYDSSQTYPFVIFKYLFSIQICHLTIDKDVS